MLVFSLFGNCLCVKVLLSSAGRYNRRRKANSVFDGFRDFRAETGLNFLEIRLRLQYVRSKISH